MVMSFDVYNYTGSTQLCPYDGATLTFSDRAVLTCPPAELICSRNTSISLLDSTSDVPLSCKDSMIMKFVIFANLLHTGCDDSCATCSRPASPAHCLTCNGSLTLRGAAPSVCTNDTCNMGTFSDSSGNCVGKCATLYVVICILATFGFCSLCCWVQSMYWSKQCELSGM